MKQSDWLTLPMVETLNREIQRLFCGRPHAREMLNAWEEDFFVSMIHALEDSLSVGTMTLTVAQWDRLADILARAGRWLDEQRAWPKRSRP